MSTRANIIIKSKRHNEKLYFYRHSDGYEKGTLPTLNLFLDLVKKGKIRDNVSQAAGWLILIGSIEYQTLSDKCYPEGNKHSFNQNKSKIDKLLENFEPFDWKCGAYEPATGIYGDIEYLYIIDLDKKEIKVITKDFDKY